MNKKYILIILLICLFLNYRSVALGNDNQEKFGNLLNNSNGLFRSNAGQWKDSEVLYRLDLGQSVISFLKDRIAFTLIRTSEKARVPNNDFPGHANLLSKQNERLTEQYLVWDITFEGANTCIPIGAGSKPSIYHFLGNGNKGGKKIGLFEKIIYPNLYNGIDLVFYIDENKHVKYDFVLQPNANVADIKIKYKGIEGLNENKDGSLLIKTAWGNFKENKPFSFQENEGSVVEVITNYFISNNSTLHFKVDGNYRHDKLFTIDPLMFDWSSFFYNTGERYCVITDIDADNIGRAIVSGYTNEEQWTIPGSYDSTKEGVNDAFVAKFNLKGDSLVFFSYIGGNGTENSYSMDVNSLNDIVIGGITTSQNITTSGTFDQRWKQGGKGFIAKLNSQGNALVFCTYTGDNIDINDIVLNDSGDIYFAGFTQNNLTSTSAAYQTNSNGNGDGFFAKMKPDGSGFYYCSYLGGSGIDKVTAIEVNRKGELYVAGYTGSSDFPVMTTNSIFNRNKGDDAFIAKFNVKGDKLIFSNLIGGSSFDLFSNIVLNNNQDIFLIGSSGSADFPVSSGAFQDTLNGNMNNVVIKLDSSGKKIVYSTYLGGSGTDGNLPYATGIGINPKDELWFTATTTSNDFPVTSNAIQSKNKSNKYTGTISKISMDGKKLLYSSYFGGKINDIPYGLKLVRVNCNTQIYLAGQTYSRDIPLKSGSYRSAPPTDTTFGNGIRYSAFIAKFSDSIYVDKPEFGNTRSYCNHFTDILDGLNQDAKFKWNTGDSARTLKVDKAGTYWVKVTYGCETKGDTVTILNPLLKAGFTISDSALCFKNHSFTFNDTTYYKDDKRLLSTWYFGDGSQLVNTMANKKYSKTGTYTVKLVVKGKSGCKDSLSRIVRVYPNTQLNFTINDSLQCFNNNSFDFINTTTIKAKIVYEWDLGDGISKQKDIIGKSYLKDSIYKIKLLSTTENNCKDTLVKTIGFYNLKADFSAGMACYHSPVQFIFTGTKLPSPAINSFHWDFASEGSSSSENPIKTFNNIGKNKVSLTITSSNGCNDTISKFVDVKEKSLADFSFGNACSRTPINFTFTGSKLPLPATTAFEWNFANAWKSTIENPSQLLDKVGINKVTLVLKSNNGCIDSISNNVDVKQQSKADFLVNDICESDSAFLINQSKDGIKYNWKFGDGSNSTIASPKHFYVIDSVTQTFNVTLVALVPNGCSDSVTKALTINANPISNFSYTLTGSKLELKAAQANNTKYQWKFGNSDSITTSSINYTKTILTSDKKNVCLKVTNLAGCVSQTCKDVSLGITGIIKPSGFKIYPNPNTGNFTVEIENPSKECSINVFDVLGNLVKSVETLESKTTIQLNVANGIYWVRVKNGEAVFNQKIVVRR